MSVKNAVRVLAVVCATITVAAFAVGAFARGVDTDVSAEIGGAVAAAVKPSQRGATHVLFDLASPDRSVFPSDVWTERDPANNTGLRISLPKPDCATKPSDCDDIDVLNELDGFNARTWISVPLDGHIDPASASSQNVFFVKLGDALESPVVDEVDADGVCEDQEGDEEDDDSLVDVAPAVVGINQAVWDPATLTLHAEADDLLEQHTRYALVVTSGLRDDTGAAVKPPKAFELFQHELNYGQTKSCKLKAYGRTLKDAMKFVRALGLDKRDVAGMSVFTTQSVTAILEKIRDHIKASSPAQATFLIGPGGTQTVFDLSAIAGINYNRQVSANPAAALSTVAVPITRLDLYQVGAVAKLAFGKFASPQYRNAERVIPAIGTRTGDPEVQGTDDIYFNLFIPSGTPPPNGWPVALYGHGGGNTKDDLPYQNAASLAAHGVATISINAARRGFGPNSTLRVNLKNGTNRTFLAGGLSSDTNGDGVIENGEGSEAAPPRLILGNRDGLRQTIADYMQLVRVIQQGMDYDGDGHADIDPERIYYEGFSFGGAFGFIFLAIESDVRVGMDSAAGGLNGRPDLGRMRQAERPSTGAFLAARTPSLINSPGLTSIGGLPVTGPFFNENIPLRNLPVVTNAANGAIDLQRLFDRIEWSQGSGDGGTYSPYVRKQPLAGNQAKSMLVHMAKGDYTAPNPRTTEIIRAGDLADRTTYFRNDLAFEEDPGRVPKNVHLWTINFTIAGITGEISRGGQEQIATFFQSDGVTLNTPTPLRFFETPIVALPETYNYIP
jgi:hypothetical protein